MRSSAIRPNSAPPTGVPNTAAKPSVRWSVDALLRAQRGARIDPRRAARGHAPHPRRNAARRLLTQARLLPALEPEP
jgi:hypothetical protein